MPHYYFIDPSPFHHFSPLTVLFWILILIIIFKLAKRGRPNWHSWTGHDAIHILRERYAKGEIDKEEYEEKKSVLEK
jgi:putative membrane protein